MYWDDRNKFSGDLDECKKCEYLPTCEARKYLIPIKGFRLED